MIFGDPRVGNGEIVDARDGLDEKADDESMSVLTKALRTLGPISSFFHQPCYEI